MFVIIFTDLDGSLLDHSDYSYEAALPSIERIKEEDIPLVIATSKTRREVEPLQRELGIVAPFIVENGGGIFFPDSLGFKNIANGEKQGEYNVIRLGASYAEIRSFFGKMASRFAIRGFGDLTTDEIAALTNLSAGEAKRAQSREFTEPFLADNNADISSMEKLAFSEGFKVTRGGRFCHLIGVGQDKGVAVKKVIDAYRNKEAPRMPTTIGIGDSENDLPMFKQVDIPVLIPRLQGGYLDIELPGLLRANKPGSHGWNDAVLSVLNNIIKIQV